MCSELNKSLYGLTQAPFNLFEMSKKGFLERNFKPIEIDPCIFFRDDCIVLCYVDDCIIFTKKSSKIADRLVQSLHNRPENLSLEDEVSLDKYLGVDVHRMKDSSIHLS